MKYTCDCGHAFEYTEADVHSHRLMAGDSTKIEDVEKLIKLPAKAINLVTQHNEIVVDMFAGSGSTLIACEQTNRVIRKRYYKFIGKGDEWQKI